MEQAPPEMPYPQTPNYRDFISTPESRYPRIARAMGFVARTCRSYFMREHAKRCSSRQMINGEMCVVWDDNRGESELLELKRAFAPAMRVFLPGHTWCMHCGWPWAMVRPHFTRLTDGSAGFFVVCDACYHHMQAYHQRELYLRYCLQLCALWQANGETERDAAWFIEQVNHHWPTMGQVAGDQLRQTVEAIRRSKVTT